MNLSEKVGVDLFTIFILLFFFSILVVIFLSTIFSLLYFIFLSETEKYLSIVLRLVGKFTTGAFPPSSLRKAINLGCLNPGLSKLFFFFLLRPDALHSCAA